MKKIMVKALLIGITFGSLYMAGSASIGTLGGLTWFLTSIAALVTLMAVHALHVRESLKSGSATLGMCMLHGMPFDEKGCAICRTLQEPPR
jgi:hypothetical protein